MFDDGAAYEQMMGRWSALVARPFLDWLQLPAGLDWLDAGCGDGSFTRVLVEAQMPRSVTGVDPAPAQLAFARQRAATATVRFVEGDAQALPMEDRCVDAAVMALVLFFLPDPPQGVRELVRVVKAGGTIAAYHWDLAGGGFPLQPILDAVHAEGYRSQPPPSAWTATLQASEHLWQNAGLSDVQTRQFEVSRAFESFCTSKQDPEPRCASRPHKQRDRSGEAQRTGTGDDKNCNCILQRTSRVPGVQKHPQQKIQKSNAHNCRHKDRRNPVCDPLQGRTGCLGFFYDSNDG